MGRHKDNFAGITFDAAASNVSKLFIKRTSRLHSLLLRIVIQFEWKICNPISRRSRVEDFFHIYVRILFQSPGSKPLTRMPHKTPRISTIYLICQRTNRFRYVLPDTAQSPTIYAPLTLQYHSLTMHKRQIATSHSTLGPFTAQTLRV